MSQQTAQETICSLSNQFFHKEWCLGTGGAMCIRDTNQIYVTPSGVQKELMMPQDIYILNNNDHKDIIYRPPNLKISDCLPLFLQCFQVDNVNAVIHTHSQNAVLVSMIYGDEFRISDMEQIKAIPNLITKKGNLNNMDTLVIPIIDNKPTESLLLDSLRETITKYPESCAILVRRHGLFVWGPNIDKTKIYNESIDYLFALAIRMKELNLQ